MCAAELLGGISNDDHFRQAINRAALQQVVDVYEGDNGFCVEIAKYFYTVTDFKTYIGYSPLLWLTRSDRQLRGVHVSRVRRKGGKGKGNDY